ncbi:hypothetical protein [Oceanobacillus arenosus]|nr:hypothetical protein [Oceanobacillus arenosus]
MMGLNENPLLKSKILGKVTMDTQVNEWIFMLKEGGVLWKTIGNYGMLC